MVVHGVDIDMDVARKCDVFRFATSYPFEDIEISVPWGSHLSEFLQEMIETGESLVKAKKDSMRGEKRLR